MNIVELLFLQYTDTYKVYTENKKIKKDETEVPFALRKKNLPGLQHSQLQSYVHLLSRLPCSFVDRHAKCYCP